MLSNEQIQAEILARRAERQQENEKTTARYVDLMRKGFDQARHDRGLYRDEYTYTVNDGAMRNDRDPVFIQALEMFKKELQAGFGYVVTAVHVSDFKVIQRNGYKEWSNGHGHADLVIQSEAFVESQKLLAKCTIEDKNTQNQTRRQRNEKICVMM